MARGLFAVPFALSGTVSVPSFEVIYFYFGLLFLSLRNAMNKFLFFIVSQLASPYGIVYQIVFLLCVVSVVPRTV